jgi:tRNA(Ile2)-agmatinylcytidine synthase
MVHLHIGLDDTDSPSKGCTTYIAALLAERLIKLGVEFVDYPNLVRLNPNVPWKTRGNGALSLRVRCCEELIENVKETVLNLVEEHSEFDCAGTDPGVVFFSGETIPPEVKTFAKGAIQGIVELKDALGLVKKHSAEAVGYKSGRGVIGALAAIGETLEDDHTYELIAYRLPSNRGTKRLLDADSVKATDKSTQPLTFNNVDREKNRVLITPRGPDPIFFGIRGETPEILKKAFGMIRAGEPIERWVIFRTNQGTDAHLQRLRSISDVQPFQPVIVKGKVSSEPRTIPLRHVIFSVEDETAKVDCAAYEPTGDLRKAARLLIVDDAVEVSGGVRPASGMRPLTINLEKMRIIKLASKMSSHNPECSRCGKTMSSMGKGQGFRCEKCGFKSRQLAKIHTPEARHLSEKLYITSAHSQRHLTKPFRRYGQEKKLNLETFVMIREWHS